MPLLRRLRGGGLAGHGLVRGRPVARPDGAKERPESLEQVLAHRYARGELDDEEYRRRPQTLPQHPAGARR